MISHGGTSEPSVTLMRFKKKNLNDVQRFCLEGSEHVGWGGEGGVGGGEKNNNVTNRAERGTSLTERHNYQLHCYWKDIADKVTAGELKFNKQTHGKNKKKLSRTAPFLWD